MGMADSTGPVTPQGGVSSNRPGGKGRDREGKGGDREGKRGGKGQEAKEKKEVLGSSAKGDKDSRAVRDSKGGKDRREGKDGRKGARRGGGKRGKKQKLSSSPIPILPLRKLTQANPAKNNIKGAGPPKGAAPASSSFHDSISKPTTYGYVCFNTFADAYNAAPRIQEKAQSVGQLNCVITEEGDMRDPQLLALADNLVVFAGAAWSLIHQRRKDEGWYDAPEGAIEENAESIAENVEPDQHHEDIDEISNK